MAELRPTWEGLHGILSEGEQTRYQRKAAALLCQAEVPDTPTGASARAEENPGPAAPTSDNLEVRHILG